MQNSTKVKVNWGRSVLSTNIGVTTQATLWPHARRAVQRTSVAMRLATRRNIFTDARSKRVKAVLHVRVSDPPPPLSGLHGLMSRHRWPASPAQSYLPPNPITLTKHHSPHPKQKSKDSVSMYQLWAYHHHQIVEHHNFTVLEGHQSNYQL